MPKQKLVGFSPEHGEILKQIAISRSLSSAGRPAGRNSTVPARIRGVGAWVMKATTSITACDWTATDPDLGTGTAKLLHKDSSDNLDDYHHDGTNDVTVTTWNLLPEALSSGDIFLGLRVNENVVYVVKPLSIPRHFLGITSGTISARSGTTVGTGTVQPKYMSGSTITSMGSTITAKSWVASTIATSTYVWVDRDDYGTYWINSAECD